MFKRIICTLILFSMLFSMTYVSASSDVITTDDTGLYTLKALEIVNGYANEDKTLDKMGKSTYINFLLNIIYAGKYGAEYNEEALQMAEQLKIIDSASGVSENDVLNGEEAVKMSMCLLGYGDYCMKNGGYPIGYIIKAERIGLTKGVSLKDEMTNQDAFKLLYNTIDTGIVDVEAIGVHGDQYVSFYSQYKDVTILNIYRDIYKVEGVVDANHTTGLYSEKGVQEGCVSIGEMQFRDSKGLLYNSLGYKTRAFVKKIDSGIYDVVCAELDNDNKIIEFKTEDVKNVSTVDTYINEIEYFISENSSKTKKVSIKKTISLLYNNKVYSDYIPADFKSPDGNVTLIDNDGDGSVDVIKLDVPKTMIVASVSTVNEAINNEYSYSGALKNLNLRDLKDSCTNIRFFMDGEQTGIEKILPGDVLNVYESIGGEPKSIDIYITRNKVTAEVTSINTAQDEIYAGDVVYELSNTYKTAKNANERLAQEIFPGKKYNFYLDNEGKIVAVKAVSNDGLKYGFLKLVKEITKSMEKEYAIRIFGDDGIWTNLYLAEKVKVNDEPSISLAKDVYLRLKAIEEKDIIGYELDKDGKLIHVLIPELVSSDFSEENGNGRFNKTTEEPRWYYYNSTSFGSYHYMTSDTRVIFIPALDGDKDNEDLYDIGNNLSFTRAEVNYVGYGCDEFGFLDLVLVKRTESKKVGSKMYLVREIGEALDSNGNVNAQITIASSTYYGLSLAVSDKALLNNVKPGDIIKVHINASGYIDYLEHIFNIDPDPLSDSEEILVKEIGNDINTGSDSVKGKIEKIDITNERILIDSTRKIALKTASTVPVLIFESDRKIVTSGTLADLMVTDYVVVQMYEAKMTGIYVIRGIKQ